MFSIPKDIQTTFIHSPTVYKNLIPEDTILYRINQKIDFSFVNEACSDLYSPDKGKPVKNTPEGCSVQQLFNISMIFLTDK